MPDLIKGKICKVYLSGRKHEADKGFGLYTYGKVLGTYRDKETRAKIIKLKFIGESTSFDLVREMGKVTFVNQFEIFKRKVVTK